MYDTLKAKFKEWWLEAAHVPFTNSQTEHTIYALRRNVSSKIDITAEDLAYVNGNAISKQAFVPMFLQNRYYKL